jgi:hypothetical protein
LRAACDAALGLRSLALPTGLALLALAIALATDLDCGQDSSVEPAFIDGTHLIPFGLTYGG